MKGPPGDETGRVREGVKAFNYPRRRAKNGRPSRVRNNQSRLPPPELPPGLGSPLLDELELEEELLELDELELLELDELELLELEDELELLLELDDDDDEMARTNMPLKVPLSTVLVTLMVRLRSLTVVLAFGVVYATS